MGMVPMSESERVFIAGGVELNCRGDGRGRMDMRHFTVEAEPIPHVNGSARVRIDDTDILVAVNVELEEPSPEKPDDGRIVCSVECTTSASIDYEGNGAQDMNQTLTRQLEQVVAMSACIDTKQLSLISGKQCWALYVDAMVLGNGGNLLDAIVMAAKVALDTATIPAVSVVVGDNDADLQVEVDGDPFNATKLPFTDLPVCVSLTKIGSCFVVDPTAEEEVCMSTRLAIAVNKQGDVCGVQKTGAGGLSPSAVNEMIKIARVVGIKLHGKLTEATSATDEDQELSFYSVSS